MKKGFTLVELIASLAIFSLAMLAITVGFSGALNTRQKNDIKQSTSGYSQSIIENFRAAGYDKIDTIHKTNDSVGVSTFIYFNDMSNINSWFSSYLSGVTQIMGNVDVTTYPLSTGKQFGALIKVVKVDLGAVGKPYHIYVRVWRLGKGSQSQSVRDIYESR